MVHFQRATTSIARKPMERVAATVAIRCLHISAERQHLGSPKILAIACDMAVSYETGPLIGPADSDTFSS